LGEFSNFGKSGDPLRPDDDRDAFSLAGNYFVVDENPRRESPFPNSSRKNRIPDYNLAHSSIELIKRGRCLSPSDVDV